MKRRNRSRDISWPMQQWIEGEALRKATPTQIYNYLQRLKTPDELEKFLDEHQADDLPSLVFHKQLYNERACQEWLWQRLSTPTV